MESLICWVMSGNGSQIGTMVITIEDLNLRTRLGQDLVISEYIAVDPGMIFSLISVYLTEIGRQPIFRIMELGSAVY